MKVDFVVYTDPAFKEKKLKKVRDLCGLSSSSPRFINTEETTLEEQINKLSPGTTYAVYTMGKMHDLDNSIKVVKVGPAWEDLVDESERERLKQDLHKGSKSNVFINVPTSKLNKVQLENHREPTLPSLNSCIDDAISGAMFLKTKGVDFAMPELNTYLSVDKTPDSMSYDEFIAILLAMKRIGVTEIRWQGRKIVGTE